MAKSNKAPATEAPDANIDFSEDDTPKVAETGLTKQEIADVAQAKANEEQEAAVAASEAAKQAITQGNGPELEALMTIRGLGGKDKEIRPGCGSASFFRCVDATERKRLISIGAAREQSKDDESRIMLPH